MLEQLGRGSVLVLLVFFCSAIQFLFSVVFFYLLGHIEWGVESFVEILNMGFIEVGNYTTIQRRSKLLVVKVHTNKKIRKSSTNFHPNCIFDELLNSRIFFFSII